MQRRYLEAVHTQFDPEFGADETDNPISSVYSGRIVEVGGIFPWTWDARPYPACPLAADAWADGPNWETGHWLNGRLGAAPLADLVAAILDDHGFAAFDSAPLRGAIDGYVIDRPMSARAAIEPLALAFGFDAVEEGEAIVFRPRGGKPVASLVEDELVVVGERAECRLDAGRRKGMNWLAPFSAFLKLATAIAEALRDRGLIAAGEARGRAASDVAHTREATQRGAEMREIAAHPPARVEMEKRLEEGNA